MIRRKSVASECQLCSADDDAIEPLITLVLRVGRYYHGSGVRDHPQLSQLLARWPPAPVLDRKVHGSHPTIRLWLTRPPLSHGSGKLASMSTSGLAAPQMRGRLDVY